MSSLYDSAWTSGQGRASGRAARLFFPAMGLAVALTVFAGFARTYYLSHWLTQPARVPEFTPLLQIHAALFTAWILLGAAQPLLIAHRNVALHRRFGIAGAALAFFVWILGNAASVAAMKVGYKGVGDPYAFYSVTFFSLQAFGIIVAVGIWKRREAETHKRLMLLSSAAILEAAIGRLPFDWVALTAPLSFYLGADLIILAGILHDRRTRARIHPVWIWGGGALALSQVFRIGIMHSAAWLGFAHWAASFA